MQALYHFSCTHYKVQCKPLDRKLLGTQIACASASAGTHFFVTHTRSNMHTPSGRNGASLFFVSLFRRSFSIIFSAFFFLDSVPAASAIIFFTCFSTSPFSCIKRESDIFIIFINQKDTAAPFSTTAYSGTESSHLLYLYFVPILSTFIS